MHAADSVTHGHRPMPTASGMLRQAGPHGRPHGSPAAAAAIIGRPRRDSIMASAATTSRGPLSEPVAPGKSKDSRDSPLPGQRMHGTQACPPSESEDIVSKALRRLGELRAEPRSRGLPQHGASGGTGQQHFEMPAPDVTTST